MELTIKPPLRRSPKSRGYRGKLRSGEMECDITIKLRDSLIFNILC